jgi:hypothetical protein
MNTTLENLELVPADLEAAKAAVREMAYFNWLNAGRPDGGEVEFWVCAERDWIEHCYVPSRPLDGTRPQAAAPAKPVAERDGRVEKRPREPQRRKVGQRLARSNA